MKNIENVHWKSIEKHKKWTDVYQLHADSIIKWKDSFLSFKFNLKTRVFI